MLLRRCHRNLLLGITLFGSSTAFAQTAVDDTVPVIVRFKTPPGQAEKDAVEQNGGKVSKTFTLVNAAAVRVNAAGKEKIKAHGLVAAVEDDVKIKLHDAELDNTWGVKQINAGTVHDSGNKGAGVKVCLLDTGINTSHPELAANYKGGYDYVNGDPDPSDDNGHGTHTAGTIAAVMNAANVRGAAPEVDLYVYKILDASGGGYASSIISALQDCVRVGGKVTNNSYGASSDLGSTVKAAFDNAKAAGVTNVASAGNSGAGANTVGFPGQYSSVIAVAATDSANTWASFSSTGPAVAISAPGVSILSTYLSGGYAYLSGTSMASPHVAGVAALVVACGITNPDSVRTRLTSTALDLGTAGRDDYYGAGLVQADKAAMNCGSSSTPPPTPVTDLAVSSVTAPSSTSPNTPVSVNVKVNNTGNQTASGFTIALNDNGVYVNSLAVPSLTAGSSTTLTFSWSSATSGAHTLASALGQTDANTANNAASTSTTVTTPSTSTITLSVTATKNRNKRTADLTWRGAAGSSVVITRSGTSSKTISTTNDGLYSDSVSAGTFSYKVCETGTGGACSPTITVVVP